jgi:predicted esterase
MFLAALPRLASATENQECVILLHGLCRTSRSMPPMAMARAERGVHAASISKLQAGREFYAPREIGS